MFEMHYLYNNSLEKKEAYHVPIPMDLEQIDSSLMNQVALQQNWQIDDDLEIKSVIVQFGKYIRPGTITSDLVQQENQTNKSKHGIGRFTIQYIPNIFPKSKTGWLRMNCKYFLYSNGKRMNN